MTDDPKDSSPANTPCAVTPTKMTPTPTAAKDIELERSRQYIEPTPASFNQVMRDLYMAGESLRDRTDDGSVEIHDTVKTAARFLWSMRKAILEQNRK